MEALINLAKNAINLNPNVILNQVLTNKELQTEIIDLNRIGQLFDKGINSEGRSLKEIGGSQFTESGYSPLTIEIKESKGQRTDHITLNDTGEFYQSFFIRLGEKEFYIEANPIKDDTNLFTEWGDDILGLTEESRDILVGFVTEAIVPKIIEFLLAI